MRRALQQELFTRRIGSFKETELPCKDWKLDKAFTAVFQFSSSFLLTNYFVYLDLA